MSDTPGLTDVQVDKPLRVRPAAPTNDQSLIVAGAGYKTTRIVDAVVFEISIRRWITVPGCR